MGRRYLPGEWVNHMTPREIVAAASNPNGPDGVLITRAVERLLAMAERYYASGRAGLAYLPFRAHFSIGVAAKVYRQIGRQLLRSKRSWHGGRQVTSKGSKVFCTLRASTGLLRRVPHVRRAHNPNLHTWLKPYLHQGVGGDDRDTRAGRRVRCHDVGFSSERIERCQAQHCPSGRRPAPATTCSAFGRHPTLPLQRARPDIPGPSGR